VGVRAARRVGCGRQGSRECYTPGYAAAVVTTPLLIDCDTGIDDALALLYACASPEAEIVGVSCVAGNVELPHIVRNTLAVLELAGRGQIEVAAGRDAPIARPLRIAADTHGPSGLGYSDLPPPSASPGERDAADMIIEEAKARPGEITLVTLGPLSNVAVALQREPQLPRYLRRMLMMVGAYRSPGNTAPTMEWNAGVDPEALSATIKGWQAAGPGVARPVAFGLDVTERAKLTPEHLERLAAAVGDPSDPIVRFVNEALRFYFEFHSQYDGFYGAFIHDALVVAAALDPELAQTEALAVEVELEGRWTTGETVTDWRRHWDRAPNLDIAVEADATRFFERFIERVAHMAREASVG
jgi:purine nucleosidase